MESVVVVKPEDLMPFDMVEEGIFIKAIHFNHYFIEVVMYVHIEAGPCEIINRAGPNGQILKTPQWGRLFYYPVKFPVTVMRGVLSDQSRT